MKILQTISLDFGSDTLPITVFAKQYDQESRVIKVVPLNHGQPYTLESGVTARLQVTKADQKQIINDATIEDGVITVELTEQTLAAEGVAVAEIGLYKGSSALSSQTFYINVKGSAYDFEKVKSSDGFGSLVDALSNVDKAVEDCNTAASGATAATAKANAATNSANTAASAANTAAGKANAATSAANEATETASTAADGANEAAKTASTAADGANTAAENANTASKAAKSATEAAEKVNISAEQTQTGADITVTNRKGEQTTVHIDTLLAVDSWADIRNAVRLGLGATLFPVGWEFETLDSDTGKTLVWVVCDHDKHTAAGGKLAHSMTIRLKNIYSNANGGYKSLVFDAAEALYYCSEALAEGTYNFTWDYATGSMVNGTYQFTLAKSVPKGGQIVLGTNMSSTAITSCKVSAYASAGATEAIESGITVTEGSDGTSLGTMSAYASTNENLNCCQRVLWGSNNYAQSAARQWLNSGGETGSVWSAKSKFDRAPSWATTYNGFMHGLPAEFLAAVQSATIPCRTNSCFEVASLDGTEFTANQVYNVTDKFFLLSRPELYGTYDSTTYQDGEQLELFEGLSNAERIERDAAGSARQSWLRSPNPGDAYHERIVDRDGSLSYSSAVNALGVAPACIIA